MVARGYSNLEYDLDAGQRGKRFTHVEELVCELTGGEAATVVNNNAGAADAGPGRSGRRTEAIVSRGELIEIGGSFRIPDVMAASGAKLVEVGTTNKTHLTDYETPSPAETALILKVHTSNYRIVGFTEAVSGAPTGRAAHSIGASGARRPRLRPADRPDGLRPAEGAEPCGKHAAGADLVCFSGDKLLGGPRPASSSATVKSSTWSARTR